MPVLTTPIALSVSQWKQPTSLAPIIPSRMWRIISLLGVKMTFLKHNVLHYLNVMPSE